VSSGLGRPEAPAVSVRPVPSTVTPAKAAGQIAAQKLIANKRIGSVMIIFFVKFFIYLSEQSPKDGLGNGIGGDNSHQADCRPN
jgi:hypothetical protein